jgi:hypothetical protein
MVGMNLSGGFAHNQLTISPGPILWQAFGRLIPIMPLQSDDQIKSAPWIKYLDSQHSDFNQVLYLFIVEKVKTGCDTAIT